MHLPKTVLVEFTLEYLPPECVLEFEVLGYVAEVLSELVGLFDGVGVSGSELGETLEGHFNVAHAAGLAVPIPGATQVRGEVHVQHAQAHLPQLHLHCHPRLPRPYHN
eukprot:CAMPEP_0116893234 /NCGR_PEP_ID=MMETSP0467-20121206/3268_1 /TAXON_ID=283647 /ORGANISM="Mesodinium pulex, Strain SPMC105" /LENGTH=107 /DNA_ID=CAMNT_0004562781 /DNA_START=1293 /DNA_END=1613 /DNA_ORIENTATION=-